jgi:hypothetical protein
MTIESKTSILVNIRFDYAWDKNTHDSYFFIGEAF